MWVPNQIWVRKRTNIVLFNFTHLWLLAAVRNDEDHWTFRLVLLLFHLSLSSLHLDKLLSLLPSLLCTSLTVLTSFVAFITRRLFYNSLTFSPNKFFFKCYNFLQRPIALDGFRERCKRETSPLPRGRWSPPRTAPHTEARSPCTGEQPAPHTDPASDPVLASTFKLLRKSNLVRIKHFQTLLWLEVLRCLVHLGTIQL